MVDLFKSWRDRVDVNGQRAVDVYTQELPDYRKLADNGRARTDMLDFAVFLRRRTVALAEQSLPFPEDDLGYIASVGQERGSRGVSLTAQRQVLVLHASLTLREVNEAAGPHDIDDVMRVLAWLPPHGASAQSAYTRGYLEGHKQFAPVIGRVQLLASALLSEDPVAEDLARNLSFPLPAQYAVLVVRIPQPPKGLTRRPREEILEALLRRDRVPVLWEQPEEFIALVPVDETCVSTRDRGLDLLAAFMDMLRLPCAAGAAQGLVTNLAACLEQARDVSRVAPVRATPEANSLEDVFVELGAARIPPVDAWLRDVATKLAGGPDLISTLDMFYRNDMSRLRTAAALHIHPRTLDYRLQRVVDLTQLDPTSVRGVRVLSATVARVLAGAWL